jgi:polysaccharide biosynthesis protein PslG
MEVEPTPLPADYNWARFDSVVAAASRQRIELLPTVHTVPAWVSGLEGCDGPAGGPCSITPPSTQLGLAAWRAFLGAAARRYGPSGLFWTLRPDLPRHPITTWQIWNEENSPGFFQPRPDVDRYAALLQAASEAIRGQDPTARILLGGLFRYPLAGRNGGVRATDYLRALYAHPGIDAAFDGVAIHPYAARLHSVTGQVERMVRVVRAAGDTQARIWITEIGWASGGKRNPLNRGPRGQARRLEVAFGYFLENRKRLGIRTVLWYAWRDVSPQDSRCKWCARAGLFRVGALVPKLAWDAFVRFTGGR